jgi:hypothetical protein
MKRFHVSRPSPAMIVAIVALIAALGGSAYAAKKIGSKQLKKNAVTTKKIKDEAVTSGKLANGAVTAGKLAVGAVSVIQRQGPDATIPAGPLGFGSAQASCQPGERATGGGVYNESSVYYLVVTSSYPTPNSGSPPPTGNGKVPTGWKVWIGNTGTGPQTVNAYVICVK